MLAIGIDIFSDSTLTQVVLLLLAFVLSALIGIERELYHTKSARRPCDRPVPGHREYSGRRCPPHPAAHGDHVVVVLVYKESQGVLREVLARSTSLGYQTALITTNKLETPDRPTTAAP